VESFSVLRTFQSSRLFVYDRRFKGRRDSCKSTEENRRGAINAVRTIVSHDPCTGPVRSDCRSFVCHGFVEHSRPVNPLRAQALRVHELREIVANKRSPVRRDGFAANFRRRLREIAFYNNCTTTIVKLRP